MPLSTLTDAERQVIQQCLRAAADGPFFPDWEFQTLFGVSRSEVRAVASAWPNVGDSTEGVSLAITNSLNNLVGYPHGQDHVWSQHISVAPDELVRILRRWSGQPVASYFDGLR
jgi:hypothetical protein